MDRQGERVAHADVPHRARTDRRVDHRQPKRAARLMERGAPNPGRSGGPEDVRCRLDRDAPRSQPAAERSRARPRRGLLACRRARPLRGARVVFLHAIRRALRARAHCDPGGPPRANLGGAAGARVEPAPVTAGKRAIGAVLALVISLHGAGLWGAAQKETSQWNRVADAHGFIVVYPSGEAGAGPRVWHEGGEAAPSRDVRFISELIDTLEAAYNIDPGMIYANGLSNGGG